MSRPSTDQQERSDQQRRAQALAGASEVVFQGTDDLQHPTHVADLPVALRRVGVGVVAGDAALGHQTRTGVAQHRRAVRVVGEAVVRLRRIAAERGQRVFLERVARSAVLAEAERPLAVLTTSHPRLALADRPQQLAQQRGRQRDRPRPRGVVGGRDHPMVADLRHHLGAVEVVDRLQQVDVLTDTLQGRVAHQPGRQAEQVPHAERRGQDDGREQAGRERIARAPTPQPDDPSRPLRDDRLTGEVAPQVVAEQRHRPDAAGRLLGQSADAERLERARDVRVDLARRTRVVLQHREQQQATRRRETAARRPASRTAPRRGCRRRSTPRRRGRARPPARATCRRGCPSRRRCA